MHAFNWLSAQRKRRQNLQAAKFRGQQLSLESLEARSLLSAVYISEVHPAGSGNGTYASDWFEVTNTSASDVDITGWKMDDNSNAFATAVALRGVTIIPAGKSAVFFEGNATGTTDAAVVAAFSSAWFGTATPPAGFLIGAYGGSGVGMSASGDSINLFNAAGDRVTGVSFGAATAANTFDNIARAGSEALPLPAISVLSTAGVNGGFLSGNGAETGSPGRTITGVDLSTYVRIGRYDLPEPTRTAAPANSLLAQEVSAVTYNWDTDTLFVVGDGSTSIVQITKTGQLIDSMTLAQGSSPQGTEFYDTEGLTYIGGGKFVMVEERDRQVVQFTYAAGTTLTRANAQTVDLGTFVGNVGIEGISYDPQTGGIIAAKEIQPAGIFQTLVDFAAGTATNGSPTAENSINLFDPALANLLDFADVYAMSNLFALNGQAQSGNLLVLSQESGKIINIDRAGNISSSLTIVTDPGNPVPLPDQQHEGLTMDGNGFLYVVSENGGGGFNFPQLWVYAPSSAPNQAPTAVALNNQISTINENTGVSTRLKVADILVTDDGLGTNGLSVTGPDAAFFEVDSNGLYLKAGTVLDFETKSSYSVTVVLDDTAVGTTPDATATFTRTVTDVITENPAEPTLFISEVAPWGSGSSPVLADWFEVTNTGGTAVNITGWKFDDSSESFPLGVALSGITSIAPGESVIFIETDDLAGKKAAFLSLWFGANPPAGLQIGNYTGGGVGLSTSGDAVNLYNSAGVLQAAVTFGSSPANAPFATFNNAAGLNLAAITEVSAVGINGAIAAVNDTSEIGSPGSVGKFFISEVAPWSSGNSPVQADWFEVTNTTAHAIDITGWKVDDSSGSPLAALALNGITSIAPGESVIFIETDDLPGKKAAFLANWFGAYPPANLQFGSYTGQSFGLSTGGDAVYLYNPLGVLQIGVTFGAAPAASPFATFENIAGVNNAAISQLSAPGVNGAFNAVNDASEIGSPGMINNVAPVALPDAVSTNEDTAATFNVLANDSDANSDTLTILSFTPAGHGTVVHNGNGSFTYTPALDYFGSDTFTYTVADGKGGIDTATVTLTVDAVRFTHTLNAQNKNFVYTDSQGQKITVTFAGKNGSVNIIRGVADAVQGDALEIVAEGTDTKTKLTIAPPKNKTTNVTDILVTGAIGSLTAGAVNILGDVSVTGTITSLTLGNLSSDPTLALGGTPSSAASTIKLGRATGLDLVSGGPIQSLAVVDWNGGTLSAPAITTFKSTGLAGVAPGDVTAQISLTQADPAKVTLKSFTVAGAFIHSTLASAGKVGSITVKTLSDTNIYIGTGAGVTGLATLASNFVFQPTTPSLASLTVKGVAGQPSFVDAVIDAWNIGKLDLKTVTAANDGVPLGIAADKIASLKFIAAGVNNGKAVTLTKLDTAADLDNPKKNPAGITFPLGDMQLVMV